MRPSCLVVRGALLVAAAASVGAPLPAGAQAESPAPFVPVTDAMLEDPAAGDWLTWRRTPDGWGYSPLDQIDTDNVGGLRLVWSRALAAGSQQGTPLAYGGVLYMPNPSDVIQAIDAVTGDLRWEYRRELPDDIDDYVNGASTNRNIAIYGNHIIDTGADNYLYALDAQTGRLAWETQILDYLVNPARHSSGPIVAGGKAISGRSCRPHGGPEACVITAHDAETGAEVWRRRLVPAPGEPGDETWGGVPYEERVHVGSWMAPSYDPELNLVYVGTSVTSPAPKFLLGGIENRYLYHNSTLALDGDTGAIVWYYQHLNDHWDLDHPFERLLVDTAVAPDPAAVSWINPRLERGEVRRVLTGIPGKTRRRLHAGPRDGRVPVGAADGDPERHQRHRRRDRRGDGERGAHLHRRGPGGAGLPVLVRRQGLGGRRLQPADERHVHAAAQHLRPHARHPGRADPLRPRGAHQLAPGTDQLGTVQAISAETGATEWLHEQRAGTMSLAATGGGLVFGGDTNGRFRAFDDETGEVLWEINLGSPVTGFPITYAVAGRQYVAVSTGTAGTASGFIRLTPELRPSAGNNLFVFALPD